MNMKDALTGELLWTAGTWEAADMFGKEIEGTGSSLA